MSALLAGVIDTPAAPEQSFGDDPLRMLRAVRFVGQLGFTLAPRTAARNHGDGRRDRADHPERIRVELDKMICGEHAIEAVDLLVATGLAERIIPGSPR